MIKQIITSLIGNLIFNLIIALIITLTWNYTLPSLFKISEISYFKSICLYILLNVMFKSKIILKK